MSSWQGIQAVIIQTLKNDTILQGICQGVWDHVPDAPALPCLILDDVVGQPWESCGMQGMQYRMDLRVVSADTGRKLATQILERARELVWNDALTTVGQVVVARQLERLDLLAETSEHIAKERCVCACSQKNCHKHFIKSQ